ncbi:TetR family transcriptional regulator [Arthrobacter sp. MYb227]|uniref:TetR/AcrR family transcriptional regulator n=1 Tax=Arthrobacter sp. MYb227 TaxID=1848601 RepID=UPI000CFC517B|nr:TetR/AcrR family transcriptional regulator [Arthrobacter sp. MYb227]PQZ93970.1 TetR family transcriptional regulator [Arthrobacter sp. MYb227]
MNIQSVDEASSQQLEPNGDGRSARWDAHRAARRLELIRLARRAIHLLGPGASMDDIATQANTSKSVFYRYFGDKDGLRHAVGEYVIGKFRAGVITAGRNSTEPSDALHAMMLAYLKMAANSPNVYFFVTASPATDVLTDPAGAGGRVREGALNDFFEELTSMMRDRMHDYIGIGPGGSASPALELWPRASIGMVRAAGELWLRAPDDEQRPSIEDLAQSITEWLTHGVAHQASGKAS